MVGHSLPYDLLNPLPRPSPSFSLVLLAITDFNQLESLSRGENLHGVAKKKLIK